MIKQTLFAVRILAWCLLTLVTLELCARTEDKVRYGAPFTGNYSLDSLYLNDELGKYGLPYASYLKWHMNEFGYRGPSLRHDTYRIACIGASETFGLYETAQKEWPRQLEDILNQRSHTQAYEVVDVAYPGLSIATSLKRLPQMLDAVHPQMVIIYPSYSQYIDPTKPVPYPVTAPVHPRILPSQQHFAWRIAGKLQTFFKAALPTSVQDRLREFQTRMAASKITPMQTLPEANIIAFQTDLDHLVTDLRAHGVQVVLVTHATRFGTGPVAPEDQGYLASWRKFYPNIEPAGLLDMEKRMSAAVRNVGASENVPVIDAATLIQPGGINFAEFVHFTNAGALSLATLVADQIDTQSQAGTIPAPPPIQP